MDHCLTDVELGGALQPRVAELRAGRAQAAQALAEDASSGRLLGVALVGVDDGELAEAVLDDDEPVEVHLDDERTADVLDDEQLQKSLVSMPN